MWNATAARWHDCTLDGRPVVQPNGTATVADYLPAWAGLLDALPAKVRVEGGGRGGVLNGMGHAVRRREAVLG